MTIPSFKGRKAHHGHLGKVSIKAGQAIFVGGLTDNQGSKDLWKFKWIGGGSIFGTWTHVRVFRTPFERVWVECNCGISGCASRERIAC